MSIHPILKIIFIFFFLMNLNAQEQVIELWKKVPNEIKNDAYKQEFRLNDKGEATGIRKVTNPTLHAYLVNTKNTQNTGVIIFPGGGYAVLSHDKEGDKIAKWFNSLGISAFVLHYRLPSDIIMTDKKIGPLQDAQEAVRILRRNAKKWNLDANKIGVIGFSAGGHLASTIATHYKDSIYKSDVISAKPDFSMLIYPVISMEDGITHKGSKINLLGKNPSKEIIEKYSNEKQITKETPPTFLVHATDDKSVPVENSIQYYLKLKENNVSAEMHIYKDGGHGFGLGRKGTHTNWPKDAENWLKENLLIPKK